MIKKRKLPDWMVSKTESGLPTKQDLPFLKFPGNIVYCYQSVQECGLICEKISDELSKNQDAMAVGFDMEWPVTYHAGKSPKTALIQICLSEDVCYLFHLSAFGGLPIALKDLILNESLLKVGVGIVSDLWKLEYDYDNIQVRKVIDQSCIDIGPLANNVLKSSERWSLDGLTNNLFQKRLDKHPLTRTGNWASVPLTMSQITYAAIDAYASLICYKELKLREKANDKTTSSR